MAAKGASEVSDWPKHPDSSKEHVYAIGMLSINYNELEEIFLGLIDHYNRSAEGLSAFLFEKLSADVRTEWLKKLMSLHEDESAVHLSMAHLISAYKICTANRNLLIHSRIMAHRLTDNDNALIASKRTRKTGEEKYYEFSLDVIRRVADEIQFWRGYAGHINAYLNRRALKEKNLPTGSRLIGPTKLPGEPSLPANLMSDFLLARED